MSEQELRNCPSCDNSLQFEIENHALYCHDCGHHFWPYLVRQLRAEIEQFHGALDAQSEAINNLHGMARKLRKSRDAWRYKTLNLHAAANNVLDLHRHETPFLNEHPAPCNNLDFCVMKHLQKQLLIVEKLFNPESEASDGNE